MLLYGPRWVGGLPLVILVPASVAVRPRSLRVLLVASALVIGPVMGFCVPWLAILPEDAGGPGIRVLTCNVQGEHLDPHALRALIARTRPAIVALQEWPTSHEPIVSRREGWYVRADKGGYCLASRYPIRTVETLGRIPPGGGRVVVVRYDLETPDGILHVFNLHLSTPRDGLEAVLAHGRGGLPAIRANIAFRRHESEVASRWIGRADAPSVLAGDFNMTGDSTIYGRCWSGYCDAFSSAGLGMGHTKFAAGFGIRIDHILLGPGSRIRRCWVGPDVGSDHRPVIAEFGRDGEDRGK